MKSLKYFLLLSGITILGCKKNIDLYPQSNLNTETFYSTASEVSTALTGCYNGLQKPMLDEWSLTELRSDNAVVGTPGSASTTNKELSDLDMFMPNTSHQGIYSYWLSSYNNIRNANLVLNSLAVNYDENTAALSYDEIKIPIGDSIRKKMAAEASFIRAYHYFNLVRLYGGVFLIHEAVSPDDAKKINRTSVENIYKLIIADLLNASSNGITSRYQEIKPADIGRATSWAAKALLAKVYLTLNQKTDAAALLLDIISNSGYGLQSNYSDVFSITNEMNSEILFAVRYKSGSLGLGSPFANLFAPTRSGLAVVNGDGKGYDYPAQELLDNYNPGDARKIFNIGVYISKIYAKKYLSAVVVAQDAENDWPVIRYADILLMLAEAQGNSVSSIALINQTRTRAGIAPLNPASINSVAQFEKVLSDERRFEFAFENQRWFDLLRFNTTFTTITVEQVIKDHYAYMYSQHYSKYPAPTPTLVELQSLVIPNRMLLPIPQREIDNNSTLVIPQNPGY